MTYALMQVGVLHGGDALSYAHIRTYGHTDMPGHIRTYSTLPLVIICVLMKYSANTEFTYVAALNTQGGGDVS